MPYTRTDMFLAAKRAIRVHPDWSDEQIAEYVGIPRALIPDTVAVARREIETAG
jgi:hypothetical protein